MTIIVNNIFDKNIKNTSLALGFFDGIHKGHQKVLTECLSLSKKLGTKSAVLTFKNHPVEILYGVTPEYITNYNERIRIFREMGFDIIIMADFTREISHLTAKEYFEKVILNFGPKSISIGYNHKFGANQSGDKNFLEKLTKSNECILTVSEPVKNKNLVISSTIIRNLIKTGDVKTASQLLEKPYALTGKVTEGAKRGRTLNFPTANIEFADNKIIPRYGVYTGNVYLNGKKYTGVANIGLRPTFNDIKIPLAEINILNFNKDIYGEIIEFEFIEKLRDEAKFSSAEQLKKQIAKDVKFAINLINN